MQIFGKQKLHQVFLKNNFIRTRASDFLKIKNILRTIEPQKRNQIKNSASFKIEIKNKLA